MENQDKAAPLVSVTFLKSASPYHEGDLAGFVAAEAKAYVDKGLAVYTEQASPAEPAASADMVAAADQPADVVADATPEGEPEQTAADQSAEEAPAPAAAPARAAKGK